MFEALKTFFMRADKCPITIKTFFDEPTSLFWLHFIENQLQVSNESILKIETSKGACFEIAAEVEILRKKMKNRQQLKFIPRKALEELRKFSESVQQTMRNYIVGFYDSIVDYLNLWSKALDGTETFSWMMLVEIPTWDDVGRSLDFAVSRTGNMVESKINSKFSIKFLLLNSKNR
jgi:hypothetical protein